MRTPAAAEGRPSTRSCGFGPATVAWWRPSTRSGRFGSSRYRPGMLVTIYYDAAHPQRMAIEGLDRGSTVVFSGIGFAIIGCGVWMLWSGLT
ncbi:DUF3592 domain-containing protein [Streptomyces sp. NPDC007164]|uniref:DUF3592 domain-containing protein n=1 Tax=Streptomyces sp. NPDC007164 TaxID=3156918 RepID=UPI0033F7E89A